MTTVYTLDVLPGHLDQLMDGSRSHVHRPPARWRPGDLVRLTDGERVAFLVVGLVSDPDPHLSRAHGTDPSLPAAASVRPAWASEIVAADQRQFLERAVQPPFEGVPHTQGVGWQAVVSALLVAPREPDLVSRGCASCPLAGPSDVAPAFTLRCGATGRTVGRSLSAPDWCPARAGVLVRLDPDTVVLAPGSPPVGAPERARDVVAEMRAESAPVPMILDCPFCHARHVDADDRAPHRTHACQSCGRLWAPAGRPPRRCVVSPVVKGPPPKPQRGDWPNVQLTVVVDGPSGSGKSTVVEIVAAALGREGIDAVAPVVADDPHRQRRRAEWLAALGQPVEIVERGCADARSLRRAPAGWQAVRPSTGLDGRVDDCGGVRRLPVPGGWLYQVQVGRHYSWGQEPDGRWEPLWGSPTFVPACDLQPVDGS